MVQRLERLADDEPARSDPVVGKKTSKSTAPEEIFAIASSIVSKNVSSTLTPYSLREVLLDPRPEVAVPVVDAERPAFGLEARRDHRVVVEEWMRDGVVGSREFELGRREAPVVASAAGGEERAQARQPDDAGGGAPEELAPAVPRLTWVNRDPNLPASSAPYPSEPE